MSMNFHRPEEVSLEQRLNEEEALTSLFATSLVAAREKEKADYRQKCIDEGRPYIKPLSVGRVGHPLALAPFDRGCERAMWYEFKEFPSEKPFDADLYRVFGFGHAAEPIVVENLRAAGFVVATHMRSDTGELIDYPIEVVRGHAKLKDGEVHAVKQIGFAMAFDPVTKKPRYKGFCDGVILSGPKEFEGVELKYPMLWENKALGDKSWKKVRDEGVEKAKPDYYSQIQQYQNFLKLSENPALFTYVNRDTGELRAQLVRFSQRHCQAIIERAARIIETKVAISLPRPVKDYEQLPCKWCAFRGQCQKDEEQRTSTAGAGHPGQAPSWLKPSGGFTP